MKKFILGLLVFSLIFCNVIIVSAATKLPDPTNLTWNVNRWGDVSYGVVSWKQIKECNKYELIVYRNGTPIETISVPQADPHDGNDMTSHMIMMSNHDMFLQSGNFTFSITAKSNKTSYTNSNTVYSDVYQYTCPSAKLPAPTQLRWEKDNLVYNGSASETGCAVKFYDQNKTLIGWTNYSFYKGEDSVIKSVDMSSSLEHFARYNSETTGFYVQVFSYPKNIEEYQRSEWSDFSTFYSIKENASLEKSLKYVIGEFKYNDLSAVDAVGKLLSDIQKYEISNDKMASSIKTVEGLKDDMWDLEESYIEETGVTVSVKDAASDSNYFEDKGLDLSGVTVIGAALNSDNKKDVSLKFSEPYKPLEYNSDFYKNVVEINIEIEGVKNQGELNIPVVISIPVPEGILPENMKIIHYLSNGEKEIINPEIDWGGPTPMATFVATGFSPYIFCNEAIVVDVENKFITINSDADYGLVNICMAAYKDEKMVNAYSDSMHLWANDNYFPLDVLDLQDADSVKVMIWEYGKLIPIFDTVRTPVADTSVDE